MYTKAELMENKKMEQILRQNKYRVRELNIKRAKKEKIENIITGILFTFGFIGTLVFIEFIERINF